jgi:apolipoprotein N-acyltransferase
MESPTNHARLRFELIFGSIWLAVGLFVMPALIYWAGASLLGPYGVNAGLSTFYGAFFADLAAGAGRTWILALGPLLSVSLVRLLFIGVGRANPDPDVPDEEDPPQNPKRSVPAQNRRIEPRVGN